MSFQDNYVYSHRTTRPPAAICSNGLIDFDDCARGQDIGACFPLSNRVKAPTLLLALVGIANWNWELPLGVFAVGLAGFSAAIAFNSGSRAAVAAATAALRWAA